MPQDRSKKAFFIAACLLQFMANFVNSLQGVLLSDYISYYGLQSASQGLISSFQYIGCIAACLTVLIIAGRIGRQYMLCFSGTLLTVPMFLLGLKPSFPMVLILYLFIGIGFAMSSNIVSSISSSLYPNNSAMMGIVHACFGAGGLLCPIIMREFLKTMPWNIVCVLNAAIAAVFFIIYIVIMLRSRSVTDSMETDSGKVRFADVRRFFSTRRNIVLMIMIFAYQAYQNGVALWVARFSENCFQQTGFGALTLSMFWLGNLISRLTMPRFRARTEVLLAIGYAVSFVVTLIGIFSGNAVVLLVCILIAGFFSGAATPFGYFLSAEWFEGSRLLPTTICGLTMFISVVVTSPLTAAIADNGLIYGMLTVALYDAAALIAILLIIKIEKKYGEGKA